MLLPRRPLLPALSMLGRHIKLVRILELGFMRMTTTGSLSLLHWLRMVRGQCATRPHLHRPFPRASWVRRMLRRSPLLAGRLMLLCHIMVTRILELGLMRVRAVGSSSALRWLCLVRGYCAMRSHLHRLLPCAPWVRRMLLLRAPLLQGRRMLVLRSIVLRTLGLGLLHTRTMGSVGLLHWLHLVRRSCATWPVDLRRLLSRGWWLRRTLVLGSTLLPGRLRVVPHIVVFGVLQIGPMHWRVMRPWRWLWQLRAMWPLGHDIMAAVHPGA